MIFAFILYKLFDNLFCSPVPLELSQEWMLSACLEYTSLSVNICHVWTVLYSPPQTILPCLLWELEPTAPPN
jgi:hypothetical protein